MSYTKREHREVAVFDLKKYVNEMKQSQNEASGMPGMMNSPGILIDSLFFSFFEKSFRY